MSIKISNNFKVLILTGSLGSKTVTNKLLPLLDNVSIVFLIAVFIYFFFVVIMMPFKYLVYSEIFTKSFTEELTKLKETYNNN